MMTQILKYLAYGSLAFLLVHANQVLAYRFNQGGFTNGGKIVINFSGSDVDGGIDAFNGYTYSPDGLLAYCEDTGVGPNYICSRKLYHAGGYNTEMTFKPLLSGSPLFNEINGLFSASSGLDYYQEGYYDLDKNSYRMHVDLLPSDLLTSKYTLDISNNQSSICKNTFNEFGEVASKKCEFSKQAAMISGAASLTTWMPGTMANLQLPSRLKLNSVGGGALVTLPSALSLSGGGWLQVPLTMPVNIKGKGTLINTINFAYSTPVKAFEGAYYERAIVDKVEIWDGNKKIFSKSIVPWPGEKDLEMYSAVDVVYGFYAGEGGSLREDIPIPGNIKISRGLNVSLHVVGQCMTNATCSSQTLVIERVGAGFSLIP